MIPRDFFTLNLQRFQSLTEDYKIYDWWPEEFRRFPKVMLSRTFIQSVRQFQSLLQIFFHYNFAVRIKNECCALSLYRLGKKGTCIKLWLITSANISSKVISVRVWNKIFRSCLLGSIVQFTHLFGNNVVETLAPQVKATLLKANIRRLRHPFEDVSL